MLNLYVSQMNMLTITLNVILCNNNDSDVISRRLKGWELNEKSAVAIIQEIRQSF